ncbi:MAG: hypothetical protein AB1847_18975 [bacterium]
MTKGKTAMQSLKKISAVFPFLKNLLDMSARVYWLYWVAGQALLLIGLAVFFIMRRRSKRAAAQGQETKQNVLTKSCLVRIWKEFLHDLPAKFRRSIVLYQPFVVLGESGAGKSLLIDNFTDWQGYANKFYPSHTAHPLLQIYLGSKLIVQEISASLLTDNSKQARVALLKLWKPLFKEKEPIVVIVLDGKALQAGTLEPLKKLAQMIRGKINLITLIRQEPVKVCICLTHMDQIEGFTEFSGFLRHNNIPLRLEFASKKDVQNGETCLEAYENYLSLALTTLSAPAYMKIISFFRSAPDLFASVSAFTKILQSSDPLLPEPEIIRLSLASWKGEGERSDASNPFALPASMTAIKYDPLLKHKQAAAAVFMIGLIYLGSGYLYERHLLVQNERILDTVEAHQPTLGGRHDEKIHQLLLDYNEKVHPLQAVFPDFFARVKEESRQRLLENIRELYLLPDLKQGAFDEPERSLYLLGLIYASRSDDLGRFVLEHTSQWKERFNFPEQFIKDYIKYNNGPREMAFSSPLIIPPPSLNLHRWTMFFHKAVNASKKSFLTRSELQSLQNEGALIMGEIGEYEQYDFNIKMCELLKEYVPSISLTLEALKEADLKDRKQKSLQEFLAFFQDLDIDYPEVRGLTIHQFLENIKTMNALKRNKSEIWSQELNAGSQEPGNGSQEEGVRNEEKKFQFTFDDEEFTFSAKKWNELIHCSRMTLFMQDFMNKNMMHTGGRLFFQGESTFPDLLMNPGNDGHLFFTGKGRVEGIYTRAAFDDAIRPVLAELPDLLGKLPAAKEVKMLFSDFISREVKAYAEEYIFAYRTYYQQFEISSSSLRGLQLVLNQIQQPLSPFQDFLLTIKENTSLNLEDSIDSGAGRYLQTFALKLHTFDFIQNVMLERKGIFPELEKYKAILAQMQEDLKGDKPFVAKNEMDDSNELKRQLSPLGRISLAIFRGEEDSYLNMVEMWLKNVEVGPEWQDIFRAPVRDAYRLGLNEVQAMVDKVSKELWTSDVQPVLRKFPFNREAANEVTLAEMENLVHPKGKFWKTFQKYLAPVCLKTGNTWIQRAANSSQDIGTVQLPQNMLNTVNEILRIGRTLWDENGIPKPLKFSIKPFLLPSSETAGPVAVLSYLRSGKSSVFGFNQQPAWHEFEFEWWKEQSAIVGVEYTTSINSRKKYRAITAPESCWSLYQLLRMADTAGENLFMWRIKGATFGYSANLFTVKFAMKTDPWSLFQLAQEKPPGSMAQKENTKL